MRHTIKKAKDCTSFNQLVDWLVGFDQELREEKTALEKQMANERISLAKAHFDGRWSLIKEMLGEAS